MSITVAIVQIGSGTPRAMVVENYHTQTTLQEQFDHDINSRLSGEERLRTVLALFTDNSNVGDALDILCKMEEFGDSFEGIMTQLYNLNR